MKIKITDTIFIKDGYGSSVILYELKKSENTKTKEIKDIESIIGYYGKVEEAVKAYIKLASVRETSNDATLTEYLDNYKSVTERVESLFKWKEI